MEVEETKSKKGVIQMAESGKEDIILMAILAVTRDDVLAGANELGIPEEQITDDVMALVREKVSRGLRDWREVIKGMVKEAIKCPLGQVCSPACVWREVGECLSLRGVK